MKVTVWSILSGRLSGHLVMSVPATHTIGKVLEAYCSNKGATVSKDYVMRGRDSHVLNLNKTLKQANIQDGETLMIGLLDDEKQTFAFGSWWLVTLASFIIGFFGIGCVVWLCFQIFPVPRQFGVVIDAGSSHSEVFLFSWHDDNRLGTHDVELVHRCFLAGGINSFASHSEDLQGYFEPCLTETKSHLPASQRANTPLYLGATAGMRILQSFDKGAAKAVLATLRQIFATSSFKFNPENVEVIPGSEEGISGWIAVNYLAHNSTKRIGATASALDVGGASLQVTTELAGQSAWQTKPISLFNHTHSVFSKSFLCYGIGEAQQRYNFYLLNVSGTSNITREERAAPTDPCLPKGLTRKVPEAQLKGPCTLTDNSQPLLPRTSNINSSKLQRIFKNYKGEEKDVKINEKHSRKNENATENESDTVSFTLQGSSDVGKCKEKMQQLFDRRLCESTFTYGDCMDAQSVPPVNGTLYAFSGLFHHLFEGLGLGLGTSLGRFKAVVEAVCSMDAATLLRMYPELDKEITTEFCFDAMFVYSLLTVGLGINETSWSNVVFSDEIRHTEVGWPQGFMITKSSSLPSKAPSHPLSLSTFILLLCLFSAFVISGFLFLHHSLKIRRHSTSYQRCIADHIDQELQRFIK
ncbi:ectonucleoside triphosphate diphosphohydrolase 1-like [Eriocheir sinensis]|uniref:ectonucleoside triphosphate diphosphohydrolase 1-like n=1 Tax=Eriocheir sinensis TaxID=95602 RepID=UPI0021C5D849|nr:ectonucleoside triphosphate diphosphohydrolase 1-like [Eriocheir sinensis]XP_050700999.1 ectonucleoside triphosphate diphosphohydrolase 1-like [Eriocheir sinensis]